MPDTLKIILILAAILLLIRIKVPLSITLLACAAALGFLFHLTLSQTGAAFLKGALDKETLKLVGSIMLIIFFSAVLKETGNMTRSISALQEVFRDARATVATIPAIIGLLPIMGGAMLSAPLVTEASDELKLSPEKRTLLNYWFRHIWEYTLPTYPGLIIASTITGIPVAQISLINLPLSLVAITVGIFLGFRGVHSLSPHRVPLTFGQTVKNLGSFMGNLLPFFVVLLLTLYFKMDLVYSLAIASLGTILYYRLPVSIIWKLGKESVSWEILALIWGVMIFKEILVASGATASIVRESAQWGMPSLVLIIALPMVLGMITGYAPGLYGLSIPVLFPLFQASQHSLAYLMLATTCGYCAILLSPMHACLVMTQEYYRADLNKLYRMLFLPVIILLSSGFAIFFIAPYFMG